MNIVFKRNNFNESTIKCAFIHSNKKKEDPLSYQESDLRWFLSSEETVTKSRSRANTQEQTLVDAVRQRTASVTMLRPRGGLASGWEEVRKGLSGSRDLGMSRSYLEEVEGMGVL